MAGSFKNKKHLLHMLQLHGAVNDQLYVVKGGSSPILYPVQTPSEDPPMTPLYLSGDGYFVLARIPGDSMDESNDNENEAASDKNDEPME